MTRTIAVVTSSRADYSHLYWPLVELRAQTEVDLRVLAFGAHLSPEFGNTVQEIERDGFVVDEPIECLLSSDSDVGMAKTIGLATLSFADVLGRLRPDLLLIIADRYEMLAPASAALALRIPIVHIEGGEISEGAIDQAVRDALTMMAHVHLTPTERSRDRVLSFGVEPWRVHRTGAPSLDHLRRSQLLGPEELSQELGPDVVGAAVVAYHPVTLAEDTTCESETVFAALERWSGPLVFCFPNADAGSRQLMRRAEEFCAGRDAARLYVNLPAVTFWSLLQHASLLVGNSSSGIMETASLGLPTVNVGIRQQGRERAANVIDVGADADSIAAAMTRATDPEFRATLTGLVNPYGDGSAAERIASILTEVPLGESLLRKKF